MLLGLGMACQPLGAMRIDNIDTPYFPTVTSPEGSEGPVVAIDKATFYLTPWKHATRRMGKG